MKKVLYILLLCQTAFSMDHTSNLALELATLASIEPLPFMPALDADTAELQKHQLQLLDETSKPKKYQCFYCLKEYSRPTALKNHAYAKHGLELKPEDIPGYRPRQKKNVPKEKVKIRNKACTECLKKFATYKELFCHINRMHQIPGQEHTYPCDVPGCTEKYLAKESLYLHNLRTHWPKMHSCINCNKAFALKCELANHMKRINPCSK